MEPNESHHQHQHQQQRLTSPFYHPFHHHHHLPTTAPPPPPPPPASATTSSLNSLPSSNNGGILSSPNDASSLVVYPHSVPSSAVTVPMDPVKRKRGRPRKYETPAQALAAKKMASSASSSSARERREQAAAFSGGVTPLSNSASRKSLLGSVGKTGQSFTPHIVNITPGEDVAQKIKLFAEQSKHELCILSASGAISNASLSHQASGASVSYQGQYEILSLCGSYIRAEHGGKTGGLSICLSSSDGEIIGGGVGGHLKAAGPVQVILGTFQLDRKKESRNGVKEHGSGSGNMLASPPSATGSMLNFHSGMEYSGRNQMRSNDEHHFMMQAPQGMHMGHTRPSEWGTSSHESRGGNVGYDLSGRRGNGSSENGEYE